MILDIAIPTHDDDPGIAACLESLSSQEFRRGWVLGEVEIISDASTERTIQRIKNWTEKHPTLAVSLDRSEVRRGKAAALQKFHARELATGPREKIVVVCDSDVTIAPNSIMQILQPFEADEQVGIVWGVDVPFDVKFGRWASSFQMLLLDTIVRLVGPETPRAYGRFFAYRLSSFERFSWNDVELDDVQTWRYVVKNGIRCLTAKEAKVLAIPAGNYRDFYLQTYRAIHERRVSAEKQSLSPAMKTSSAYTSLFILYKTVALFMNAGKRPHWAGAFVIARVMARIEHLLRPANFGGKWESAKSTKPESAKRFPDSESKRSKN